MFGDNDYDDEQGDGGSGNYAGLDNTTADDSAPNDRTTKSVQAALKTVNDVLMYGRKKYGLLDDQQATSAGTSNDQPDTSAKTSDDQQDTSAETNDNDIPSYAAGGDVEQDDTPTGSPAGPPVDAADNPSTDSSHETGPSPVRQALDYFSSLDSDGPPTGSPAGPPVDAADDSSGLKAVPQMIMRYLQGADAAPPSAQENLTHLRGSDFPIRSEGAREIQRVFEEKGPEAAWGLMQHNRVMAEGFRGAAHDALVRGNVHDAANFASKGVGYIPGDAELTFKPSYDGTVTATLNSGSPTEPQARTYNLTLPQFNAFLQSSPGQFDHILDNGIAENLAQLAQSEGVPVQRLPGGRGETPDQIRQQMSAQQMSAQQPRGRGVIMNDLVDRPDQQSPSAQNGNVQVMPRGRGVIINPYVVPPPQRAVDRMNQQLDARGQPRAFAPNRYSPEGQAARAEQDQRAAQAATNRMILREKINALHAAERDRVPLTPEQQQFKKWLYAQEQGAQQQGQQGAPSQPQGQQQGRTRTINGTTYVNDGRGWRVQQ